MALCMAVSIFLLPVTTGSAMSQLELQNYRAEAQQTLDNTDEVSWYDLRDNESGYAGQNVKFTAKSLGIDPGHSIGFKDDDGNLFAIAYPLPYRFKPGTKYTISATFSKMVTVDGETAAVFTVEQTHLPVMSEYGL
ncbi:MAG: hypothetical protein ABFD50_14515 [Smithella sp.]